MNIFANNNVSNPSLKQRLASGKTLKGIFLLSGNSVIAEFCGTLPLDWIIVDGEAAPSHSKDSILSVMQALNGSEVAPCVRLPSLDKHLIEHALDVGAHGILVPKIDNAERARAVADAALFPPKGNRGLNPVRASGYFSDVKGYINQANDNILVMVQIESVDAVKNIEEIAAVDGIDVLFIGMGDMSLSLGQPCDMTGPAMDGVRKKVIGACRAHNKSAGIFAYSLELAQQYKNEGFQFIAFSNEIKVLKEGLINQLEALK